MYNRNNPNDKSGWNKLSQEIFSYETAVQKLSAFLRN